MRFPGVSHDVTSVLLDIDGTLLDSNDAHARAWYDAFREAGFDVPFDRIRPLIGMGGDHLVPALVPTLRVDEEPGKSLAANRAKIFKSKYMPGLRPTNGARDLLLLLRKNGVRRVIATSAKRDEIDGLLHAADIADLIDTMSTADDAPASKPAPDVVTAALGKADAVPQHSVMLGDTRFDVEAATRSGVATVALRCGGAPEDDLARAAAVFTDPAELAAALL